MYYWPEEVEVRCACGDSITVETVEYVYDTIGADDEALEEAGWNGDTCPRCRRAEIYYAGDTRVRVLEFIKAYKETHTNSPTFREIGDAVGLASTSAVSNVLEKLEGAGLIERDKFRPRSIRILKEKS